MRFRIRYITIAVFAGLQLFAAGQGALAREDINTDPLFMGEQIYYQPIPAADLEAEKVKALQSKDAKKMYSIGMMYSDGNGVESDMLQAAEWFKNAATEGNSDAMVELARIYSIDKEYSGMDKNDVEARRWITEAEKRGNSKALYTLGLMYEDGFPFEKSYEKSFEYYKKAALRGILNAYVKLYIAYQYGKGVEPDLKEAIYWLRKIQQDAEEGKVKEYARQMLSDIYFEVALKETDPVLKFKLFNLSWSNGNRYALEAIGDLFQAGVGVKQNYQSAMVAYNEAIKRYESVYAMERLGFIYFKGPAEIDRDYAKAMEYFKRASDLGGVTAAYMMGYIYYYGLDVPKDPKLADTWFARSKQFAARKRSEMTTSGSLDDKSNTALRNIITNVNKKEEERQMIIQDKINSNSKGGAVGPDLPDVSKY